MILDHQDGYVETFMKVRLRVYYVASKRSNDFKGF